MKPNVMILLGSASDFKIAEKATEVLENLGISYDLKVASAHRTHEKVKNIMIECTESGVDVFLGIAGLSAHLPGIMAANTYKPVVGVPVDVKLGGLDALFASVQMPFGAPVATVGIDRGENGALLASQIIGIHDRKVRKKVSTLRTDFFDKVQKDEEKILKKLDGNYYSPISLNVQKNESKTESKNKELYKTKKFESGKDESYKKNSPSISVIAGSYSDMKIAKKTTNFLDKMQISYDLNVISPIRYPEKFENYLKNTEDVDLFIAITGLSAHVTGAIVAKTEKPVIGVPCPIHLEGIDALFSMVNMPPGVPVATVGIGNGGNAAFLASEMLGIGDKNIMENILSFKSNINRLQ
ncbi:MAG: 5-(carboxyamino)imidazole ribonucleotide mutase [Euryarchaeota archaeon]|nr:5-(carboxyamino)imidazole ribonucleotide mutase [Euryarchaeota archaeon]